MESQNEKLNEQIASRRNFGKSALGVGLAYILASYHVSANAGNLLQPSDDYSQDGYEGNIAVCTVLMIKKELEQEADSVWDRHKKWLKETHGPWGMVSYTVAKNDEMKNPLNPTSKEKTGVSFM